MFRFGEGFGMGRGIAVLVAILAILPSTILAQAPAASTFYISDTETQFSLNIANDSSDVSIYFTSPAYSWVAVGFGENMKDSLMFVLYPSKDGKNVTISPRLATGHSEPGHENSIQLEALPGTGIIDDMFVVKAVCKNCRVWTDGFLDVKNAAHPMIFAFGPGNRLQSDSLDAPLRRHVRFGRFTMDMQAATGKSEVPGASQALAGVTFDGEMTRDHDRMNLAHAVLGCLALFVLWPLNVVCAGFLKKIGIHIGISVFILVFLIISYALGIATSGEFNRSKTFTSPHQILAFLSLLPIVLISILPFPRISSLHTLLPRLHTPLVSATLTLLILTGGLGLHLSSQSTPIIMAYTAIALGVFVFVVLLQTCIKRRGSAYARQNGTSARRLRGEEDDEEDLVMKAWKVGRGMDGTHGQSQSQQSFGSGQQGQQGHGRGNSGGNNLYGGGTMPGPQYMLNMHPGVPVHRW
ncbi:hypothetical protein BCR34DRAFT_600259 [Clohesyomyces aquaticus]|uniref:DOMON domain-containing protein n=1 Tax=Clohesyomyces aquaticus TaxID=1231657 RepID=A0A1Y1ZRZ3_9PLEO|nr:hypothetical protein BCR34DRAFT_600259 [Clohesyomyces aquaticus]